MFRKLKRKVSGLIANADTSIDNVESEALVTLEALQDILEEGVTFKLEIAGREIPVKLTVEPDDS